ncbi:MAG: T9SS type A sorting domain-containing protein [Bacteroidia bacterium]|nr:T9SS type A sorting domain-containing protein [Bacteroidia bacterium]MCF8425554.1 T9SS type A sorting domain-containing protein [Bacteroidia bacterium]MCF8445867.1 T9SS type A sorting domain-containing protein [Bacteroidia bacterium]
MKKNIYKFSFLALFSFLWIASHAQSYSYFYVPTAANGTSGSGRGPITTSNAHRSCAIYSAAEFAGLLNSGDTIFRLGFSINNTNTVTSPVVGNIKIYLVNTSDATYLKSTTWTTILTSPTAMDTNYNGTMTIPASTGPFFVSLTKPFVYTGGGVYLAYEWTLPTAASASMIYNCNTAITSGQRNVQGASLATLTTLTGTSSFRAQLYLGVKTPSNDAQILETYSLGKLPIPFAAPHIVKARVKNGGSDTLIDRWFYLNVGPVNLISDSIMVDTLLPSQEKTIEFPSYSSAIVGFDTVKVSCAPDNNNANNLKKYGQAVNLNTYNYADPLKPANGGVGFTSATGDFVAKFPYTGSNSINQIGVNFSVGGTSLKVGIWDTATTGAPGTLLWSSNTFTTLAGLNTIPVNPPVPVSGTFFVGVIQTGTVNASFSFQSETPIRGQTFYYTSPTGSTTWSDFLTTNSNFRFMVEPRLQMANDIGTTEILSPCNSFPLGQGSIVPTANIYNYGSNTQFAFTVKAQITNASNTVVYNDSSSVSFILPNDNVISSFTNAFTPTTAGTYTVKVWTELMGDGDPNNDTATKTIVVEGLIAGADAGYRLQLDGIDDYISIPYSATTTPIDDFTIETWVRPSNVISVGTLYSKDSLASDTSLRITMVGLTPQVVMQTTSSYVNLLSTVNAKLNSWSHIALTYDGSHLILYVNGTIGIDTFISGSVITKMGPTYLGRLAGTTSSLNAGIENFIFRNEVLSASEIRLGLHRKHPALTNPHITCYLRFDEGAGSVNLADVSGNCNVGSMNNFDPAVAWFISSLPQDTGYGTSVNVISSGPQTFAGKNLTLDFANFSGSTDVVAHYIKGYPLGFLPDTVIATSPKTSHNNYWILYEYGSASYDSCLATFQLQVGNIGAGAINSNFYLSMRDNGASGLWTLGRNPADTVNISGQALRFWLPTSNTFVTQYGITSSGSNNPLPVTYAYFKGAKSESGVTLNWATVTESNSSHFILERSLNGKDFNSISKVKAAGNSSKFLLYNYLDKEALSLNSKVIYYRLNQVDMDGKQEYSPVIQISLDELNDITILSVQPNPFQNNLTLTFNSNKEMGMKVELLNINGQIMVSKEIRTEAGQQNFNLDETGILPSGLYFVRIEYNGQSEIIKVIKSGN